LQDTEQAEMFLGTFSAQTLQIDGNGPL